MAHVDGLTIENLPELSAPRTLLIAFSGWSDAGSAATNAVQYVAAQLSAQKFATIDGEEFFDFTVQRPLVKLDEQQIRQLDWPGWQFSAARNLVFATGPEPHLRWRTFCDLIVRLLEQVQIERVALLGAFLAEVLYTDPVPLTGFSSDPVDSRAPARLVDRLSGSDRDRRSARRRAAAPIAAAVQPVGGHPALHRRDAKPAGGARASAQAP